MNDPGFLPEDYVERKIARRTDALCLTLFALVLVGTVSAFFVTGRQWREVIARRERVVADFERAARLIDQMETLQSQKAQMLRKARVTSVLVERAPRTYVLAELINHMPDSLSLEQFTLESKAMRPGTGPATAMQRARLRTASLADATPEPPPMQTDLSLVGFAPTDVDVSDFMRAISVHPAFTNMELQYSEMVKVHDQAMRKFRLDLRLAPDLDLTHIEPTRVHRGLEHNPMSDEVTIGGLRESEMRAVGDVNPLPGTGVAPASEKRTNHAVGVPAPLPVGTDADDEDAVLSQLLLEASGDLAGPEGY